jgi:hypothetical protein
MATNSGACKSDTAGTATLTIFKGASAEKANGSAAAMNIAGENMIFHRFIAAPTID